MDKTYILNVGEHTYEASRPYINQCIKLAKDAMKKECKMAIVALEKDNIVIMAKEKFVNVDEFNKTVKKYMDDGYTVHKIRR